MSVQKKITFYIFACFLSFSSAWAESLSPQVLEKITVKRSRAGFSQQSYDSQEIEDKNLGAPDNILNYVTGLDLRSRGSFGVLDDISLRGSTFEQVAVLIDGVNVMDPQTGHFNLDIPFTVYDLEQVAVTKNASSGLYGAGAFAGNVNFAVKKPVKESANVETFFGENALFGQAFSYSMPQKNNFSARLSYDHKIAKAARPNTDFEHQTGSLYVNKDFITSTLSTILGWQRKDFGADSFYSNMFPEEEEHTQTLFTNTSLDSQFGQGRLKNDLYLRRHRDKFILRRNNPTSVNYHTTYVYGLNSAFDLPVKFGNFSCGLNVGRDQIGSTNLGHHSRIYEAGLLGLSSQLGQNFDTDIRARFDHYQKWSWQKSFNFGFNYKIIKDKLNLKSSFGRGFRIPTFTELYYADAANIGNPGLGIEQSDTWTLGVNFRENLIDLGVEGFLRRGRNLIDWTRASTSNPWRANNLGRIDFRGVAVDSKIKPRLNYQGIKLDELSCSYNYTSPDKKAAGFFSKYALDILMHQLILGVKSGILGLGIDWQFSYNKRYYADDYFLGSVYISKKLVKKNYNFEPFLKIENFTNKKYSEVAGVVQPGRWVQGGVKLAW